MKGWCLDVSLSRAAYNANVLLPFASLLLALMTAPPLLAQEPPGNASEALTPTASAPGLTFLPLESRSDVLPFVEEHVPGAYRDSNWGGLRIQGSSARETRLSLDGIRVRALRVPMLAIGRLDVLGAGLGAAHADVTGGEVALGSAAASDATTVGADLSLERGRFDKQRLELATFTPLPGRLDLVAALQASRRLEDSLPDRQGAIPTPPDAREVEGRTFLKLGWRPVERHRLELLTATHHSRFDPNHITQSMEAGRPRFDEQWWLGSLRWDARSRGRLRTGARVSLEHEEAHEGARNCPGDKDCASPAIVQRFPLLLWLGPYPWDRTRGRTALEVAGHMEVGLPSPVATLELGLRLVPRARSESWRWRQSVAGNTLTEYQGGAALRRTQFFANDPRVESERLGAFQSGARADEVVTALEAPLSVRDRLHVVPGIAMVGGRLQRADQSLVSEAAVAHVLRVAWRPLKRSPLWLRASTSRRVDGDLDYAVESTRPRQVERRCLFNDVNQQFDRECTYNGGDRTTVGLPCGPAGLAADGTPCTGNLRLPRMWEHTLGGEATLPWGVRTSLDLIERRTDRTWTTLETNRIWNMSGTAVTGYRSGRAEMIVDLASAPQLPRRHRAVMAAASQMGRLGGLQLAYTWMRSHGDLSQVSFFSAWGDVGGPLRSPAPVARHFLDLRGHLDLGPATFGALYRYAQGDAYLDSAGSSTSAFDNYRAARGVNPGTSLNDPGDDRFVRRPTEHDLHLQFRVRGKRLTGVNADLYLDVLEVIHTRRTWLAGAVSAYSEPPRLWRMGLEVRH